MPLANLPYHDLTGPLVRGVGEGGGVSFSPLSLFASGEQGGWYDPSDLTTLFQDSAGTTPVTASGQPVGKMLDKSGRSNHLVQATTSLKPIYTVAGGLSYLVFDGVDDYMATTAINFSGSDAMTVVAGLRKLSDATVGMIVELSANANANIGAFRLTAGNPTNTYEAVSYGGSAANAVSAASYVPPITNVVSMTAKITAAQLALRVNGAQVASSVSSQGAAAAYGNYVMYVGRRGGSTLPLNGNLHALVVRAATSTATQLTNIEHLAATKSGVTL